MRRALVLLTLVLLAACQWQPPVFSDLWCFWTGWEKARSSVHPFTMRFRSVPASILYSLLH